MGHKKLVLTNPSDNYPAFLKNAAKTGRQDKLLEHPVLIEMGHTKSLKQLEDLIKDNPDVEIVDNYDEQYAELLLSKHAHLYRAKYEVQVASIEKMLKEHY